MSSGFFILMELVSFTSFISSEAVGRPGILERYRMYPIL